MTVLTEKRPEYSRADLDRAESRVRRLRAWVIVLALAVVGLGVWVGYDLFTGSDTAVSGEIQALLDDYREATNAANGSAFMALVTDDFVFETPDGTLTESDQALEVVEYSSYGFNVERIGEPLMMGDGPWYVSAGHHLDATTFPADGYDGISTFTIVDDDGTLKIARHSFIGNMWTP